MKQQNRNLPQEKEPYHLPHIGQRIVKTTLAVFLCLFVYWLMGYRGQQMPTEAGITAIICMQPYVKDSGKYAFNRLTGTLIGVVWGLLLLLLMLVAPVPEQYSLWIYICMAAGVLLSLYTAVLVQKPDAASLAAIVFLCVVIAFPDIQNPLLKAGNRILGVFIGTTAATFVNVFRLPRRKNRDLVFFVRTKDLVPDRFSHISPAAHFRLNYLYEDGARICLVSEHAPAFFMLQMGGTMLNTPLIVMDGAAIYDPSENTFLQTESIPAEDSYSVRKQLNSLGISYFIYTIHRSRTCIFHHGAIRQEEAAVYERMRKSPYRSYLEGEVYEPEEIVYIKIIVSDRNTGALDFLLHAISGNERLRSVWRPQAGSPGVSALYIYSRTASPEYAEQRLMALLHEKEPQLRPVRITARNRYRSERDAMHLLYRLESQYEPLWIFRKKKAD